jgi:hypothetical protein
LIQAARRFKQKVVEGGRLRKMLRGIISRSNMLNVEICPLFLSGNSRGRAE